MRLLSCPGLFALISLVAACGPVPEGTETTGSSSSATETAGSSSSGAIEPTGSGSSGATEPEPTDGEAFPMCEAPKQRDDFGFEFHNGTLPFAEKIDLTCQIDGGTSGGGVTSATIALTCTDGEDVAHAVSIDLRAYGDLELAFVAALPQVRLVHEHVDDFTVREVLALRGLDDALLLFAGSGYGVIAPEYAPLWAPLTITPVEEALCATEVVAECESDRRSALDITQAGVSERVFDQDWVEFADGVAAHVGGALVIDRYLNGECIGDSIDGLEMNILVFSAG
jgi:hypothetical protein